ncbi:MAG: DUF4431 domain-containing protein [Myxococcota bacterium]|jgi:hypothetical protein|nr:DUF4431 domain-containing protein [Myxococcota bacterium]
MRFVAIVVFLALLVPASAAARCLKYEPAIATLEGSLSTRVVPGPPGYVSVARGDMPETIVMLKLDASICVLSDGSSYYNIRSHGKVEEVQLEVPLVEAKRWAGKKVRATGSLFGAHTRHHRTPVGLRVAGLRAARKPTTPSAKSD